MDGARGARAGPAATSTRERLDGEQKETARRPRRRLWEVQPFYGVPLSELAELFDTVYVSFYKGVGALASAMVLGSAAIVAKVRREVAIHGGKLHTAGPLALSAELALARSAGDFAPRFERLRAMVAVVGAAAADAGVAVEFDPPVPESAMVHCYLPGRAEDLERLHAAAAAATGVTLWNKLRGPGHARDGTWSYFEWSAGPGNVAATDDDVTRGWAHFLALCKAELPAPAPAAEPETEVPPEPPAAEPPAAAAA